MIPSPAATCQSGYGAVCKTVYPGSIPGVASITDWPPVLSRDSRAAQRIEVPDHVGDSCFGCPSVGQPAESCLAAVCVDVGPQHGIHARQMPVALLLKPLQNVAIDAKMNRRFAGRHHNACTVPEFRI